MSAGEHKLKGLSLFTDETGILQHSKFGVIDRRHGYSTDDNARALIAAVRHHRVYGGTSSIRLAKKYLEFLLYMHFDEGGFHNFLSYDKKYLDEKGTEDSVGHALWAAGCTINSSVPQMLRQLARLLFDKSLPEARDFTSPRGNALTLLGLCEYRRAYPEDENLLKDITSFSGYLVEKFGDVSEPGWLWFEPYLTYANPRISQALLEAYEALKGVACLEIGKASLDFLVEIQLKNLVFHPIGTDGWYSKGGKRAYYDQQPIEASCMVEACLSASRVLEDRTYIDMARGAFEWFHGRNSLGLPLVEKDDYTCFDGLTPLGLNQNKGAESTISYLLAELLINSVT